jgi:hypothetical protein
MATDPRHLEWANVLAIIRTGAPAVQPIAGEPWAHLFVDDNGSRMGLRVAFDDEAVVGPSPLAAVSARRVWWRGDEALEVSSDRPVLFQPFYDLLRELADQVQLGGVAPGDALEAIIDRWQKLLRPSQLMSAEQQLGLAGELWTLARLLRVKGVTAMSAWTGPLDEPHDFRFDDVEIEVKTTWRHRRVHPISSLEQLLGTAGRRLFLLSLQMEAAGAGAGWTLPEQVEEVRALISGAARERGNFEDALLITWRYADEHASQYTARMEFRQPPMLVEILAESPRITRAVLETALGPAADRIPSVRYDLDVERAGVLDGSPEFLAILPEIKPYV